MLLSSTGFIRVEFRGNNDNDVFIGGRNRTSTDLGIDFQTNTRYTVYFDIDYNNEFTVVIDGGNHKNRKFGSFNIGSDFNVKGAQFRNNGLNGHAYFDNFESIDYTPP